MIVVIFIILVALSLFLISLGYLVNENAYSIIGFFFLFLLSITIVYPGNIAYKTGEQTVYTYGANFTTSVHWDELHPSTYPTFNPSEDPIYLFHTNITNSYSYFDSSSSHWFGIWLAVISGVGIAISLVEITPLIRREL